MKRQEISNILKRRMRQLDLTHSDVARKAKFKNRQLVTEIVNNKSNFTIDNFLAILKVLKLNMTLRPLDGSTIPEDEESNGNTFDFKNVTPQ